MRSSLGPTLILALVIFLLTAGMDTAWARSTAPYPGYVSDVDGEKSEAYVEVYLYAATPAREQSLQELIFNPLASEFKSRYQDKFGRQDSESILYQNSFRESKENRGNSAELELKNEERRAFAEYMTRRLLEYHVDHYMNTKPELRPIMEVKEKIQNVKVQVSKDTRLNIQYNFAANIVDFTLDNPYCDSKLSLEMDPKAFGPGNVNETRLKLGKDLTKTIRVNSNILETEGTVDGDITKSFARYHLATSLGIRAAYKDGGTLPRETLYTVGFTHSY